MKQFRDQVKKMEEKLDYKSCRNCKNQIEPLRMCKWAERGGDGEIHLICPMWVKKVL